VGCGHRGVGENNIQEGREVIEHLDPTHRWHFFGRLPSNKAGRAARLFQLIETVDRIKIARSLERHAEELGKSLDILVQVNIGREPQKSGVLPEETEELLQEIQTMPHLSLRGLMTSPPYSPEPEASRPWFRKLKELADRLAAQELFADNQQVELSMGMSNDFPVAIEEGATLVRVGTRIFGPRNS
jgi:pyridoxal phosphate enzyme (YggS family)